MNFKKLNALYLSLFLIISLFVVPMNFGYATTHDEATGDIHTINEVRSTCSVPVNVKDSLILSIVTICIPGILEKVKEFKEISCEAAVCKYNAIIGGIDPTPCEDQKNYKVCKYIWGEIFVIPPLALIEFFKDLIKELIANPVGILYAYGISKLRTTLTAACSVPSPACKGSTVGILATGLFINDIIGVYQTFEDMAENGYNGGKVEQNFCEQARDIKKKLIKTVINPYKELQKIEGENE
ncbi:MAG: hypothetical protein HRU03_00180 [Nanoarchaeales archaeon]|nr:hypothetical protein [Nanoarchaeales archaeon]